MAKIPLKFNGVYVRLLKANEHYQEETKISRIFNVATGRRDEHYYEIILLRDNRNSSLSELRKFEIDVSIMYGELLGLVDWHRGRSGNDDYFNVDVDNYRVSFETHQRKYSGSFDDDFLSVRVENKETGDYNYLKFRFIPWD